MELKLGKLEPVIDNRTIPLKAIIRPALLPPLPSSFDVDESLGGIQDDFLFNNSVYGDCVIAARAHQTLRFEKFEQGTQIEIKDQEVVDEYFEQTGGRDTGLVLLTSLKDWRNDGWSVGGRNYTIYAFASVDWHDHDQVKHSIHLLNGLNFGMMVFRADMEQFNSGEGWHLTGGNGYFQGRHGVYACRYRDTENGQEWAKYPESSKVVSYSQDGVWAMTWGRKQFMTWDFWDARVDECYAIVDNRNSWLGDDSPVDLELLDGYLKEITGQEEDKGGCVFPFFGKYIRRLYVGKRVQKQL